MSSTLLVLNDMRARRGLVESDLDPSDRVRATEAFATLLRHARAADWMVAHIMRERSDPCMPVSGLEPLRTEHVFLLKDGQGPDSQHLHNAVACGLRTLVVAGFTLNDLSASMLRAGLDLGVRVLLVAEAGDMGDRMAVAEWARAGVRVAPAAQIISGFDGEIVWLRDFASRRAGHGGNDGL
jgi:hypothetical protein